MVALYFKWDQREQKKNNNNKKEEWAKAPELLRMRTFLTYYCADGYSGTINMVTNPDGQS
jgi:hypothetical protein